MITLLPTGIPPKVQTSRCITTLLFFLCFSFLLSVFPFGATKNNFRSLFSSDLKTFQWKAMDKKEQKQNQTMTMTNKEKDMDKVIQVFHLDNNSMENNETLSLFNNTETLKVNDKWNNHLVTNDSTQSNVTQLSDSIACTWSPYSDAECVSHLSKRLPPSQQRRHWFFFGDSTMSRMWSWGNLSQRLISYPRDKCKNCHGAKKLGRCRNNQGYGLSIKTNWSWNPPNELEGPGQNYGARSPNCLECSSCKSSYLTCNQNDPCSVPYGGYLAMEFARDVVLQTKEYNTTQENIALFLQRWITAQNATSHTPICVINVGLHDISLPNVTDDIFVSHMRWTFYLLHPVCSHVVWIHLTAPYNESRTQKTPRLKIWNEGVLRILESSPDLRQKSSVVDVFAASQRGTHSDNVHLSKNWYRMLGYMFLNLIPK